MKPIPAWIVTYMKGRPKCDHCFRLGMYADPFMRNNNALIAMSPQGVANGWKTIPCPSCGANAKPK